MPADYTTLAPIYPALGMDVFAESITPRLIDFAQRNDWMGRRILELGCGTGASLEWLTRRNYIAVGIDQSAEMLELCRQRMESAGLQHDLRQQDACDAEIGLDSMDMVLALDMVNELSSLRDLEVLFKNVHAMLNAQRLFVFDLHTIEGLTQHGLDGEQVIFNNANLTVVASNSYDFDRQIHDCHYLVFHRDGEAWRRSESERILRSYPVQAVAALLQRCGFSAKHVITTTFEDFEPGTSGEERVIFLAEKS